MSSRPLKRWAATLTIAATAAIAAAGGALADITAKVDLGDQTMRVYVDGRLRHTWSVSTGREGYDTPTGTFRPQRLEREWYSSKYDDAPMPYSVFYSGGYAIHGGFSRVGGPASHGCIRLATGNAARFFALVSEHGASNTRIQITD